MSETIVQVDNQGEVIGPIDRDTAHENYILHPVVFAFLLTCRDGITPDGGLFIVRSPNAKTYPGRTSLPAGHIQYEADKSLEELGIKNVLQEVEQEIGVSEIPLTFVGQEVVRTDDEQQLVMVYRAIVSTNLETHPAPSEVKEVQHLSFDEVLKLVEAGKFTPFALAAMKIIGIIPSSAQ